MFIPPHGDLTDVAIMLVSGICGWFAKRICWMRSVDVKLAAFSTDIDWIKQAISGISMQLAALKK